MQMSSPAPRLLGGAAAFHCGSRAAAGWKSSCCTRLLRSDRAAQPPAPPGLSNSPGLARHACRASNAPGDAATLESIYYAPAHRPKLLNRKLSVNPVDTALGQLGAYGRAAHLWAAAMVDRFAALSPVLSAAAFATAVAGLSFPSLLCSGLPLWARQQLFQSYGTVHFTAPGLAAAALALPLAAWVLRQWLAAAWQLLNVPKGLGPAFLGVVPAEPEERQEMQQALIDHGDTLTCGVLFAHSSLLYSAATFLAQVGRGGGDAVLIGSAVFCWVVAALPAAVVAWKVPRLAAGPGMAAISTPAAVAALLGLEAAILATAAAPLPVAAAAAAAAAGVACLQALQVLVVAPDSRRYQAQAGDTVEVLVTGYVEGNAAPFDCMDPSKPLQLPVGVPPVKETEQAGARAVTPAAADGPSSSSSSSSAAAGGGATGTPSSSSSSSSSGMVTGELDPEEERLAVVSALEAIAMESNMLKDPQSRWMALWPVLARDLSGRYLGEELTVVVDNGDRAPYFNPAYCWWQPLSDYMEKFRGRRPDSGEVFKYEVRERCWLDTQVTAVGTHFVQLDANYGLVGQRLLFKVRVVSLTKQQQVQS